MQLPLERDWNQKWKSCEDKAMVIVFRVDVRVR